MIALVKLFINSVIRKITIGIKYHMTLNTMFSVVQMRLQFVSINRCSLFENGNVNIDYFPYYQVSFSLTTTC